MSHEPATKHFSAEQLASFLDQLGQAGGSGELELDAGRVRAGASQAAPDPQLAPVDPRWSHDKSPPARAAALAEPATVLGGVLGGGHVIPIGAPKWRARGSAEAGASARSTHDRCRGRPAPSTTSSGAASPSHARLREPSTIEPRGTAELLIPGLSRTRPWRVAFVVAALLSAGLLAALASSPTPSPHALSAGSHKPPPLPLPPATSPKRAAVTTPRPPPQVATPASASPAARTMEPSMESLPQSASAHARREAVDLLLAGRTRAALDAYRGLLAVTPSPAFEAIVRLLERELSRCAHSAGVSCARR